MLYMTLNGTGSNVKLATLIERVLSIFLSYMMYGMKKNRRGGNVGVHCYWIISNLDSVWEVAGYILFMIRYNIFYELWFTDCIMSQGNQITLCMIYT